MSKETETKLPVAAAVPCSVLFIGGLADGQRRPDPGQHYWKIAGDIPVPRYNTVPMHPVKILRNDATYRRERMRAEGEDWIIYVLDSLTLAQAMGKLVRGYSPQNALLCSLNLRKHHENFD